MFDQTLLKARLDPTSAICEIMIRGTLYSIADVAEIIAWLNATLIPSKSLRASTKPVCTTPRIRVTPPALDSPLARVYESCPGLTDMTESGEGRRSCWMNLFGDLAVTKGYPVPRRLESNSGLEIPLNIMAKLANARQLSRYGGKLLLKGYSTILVPTKHHRNFIFWHMLFKEDGTYMSYSDTRVSDLLQQYPTNLSISDLEISRHILGWCANVDNCVGKSISSGD